MWELAGCLAGTACSLCVQCVCCHWRGLPVGRAACHTTDLMAPAATNLRLLCARDAVTALTMSSELCAATISRKCWSSSHRPAARRRRRGGAPVAAEASAMLGRTMPRRRRVLWRQRCGSCWMWRSLVRRGSGGSSSSEGGAMSCGVQEAGMGVAWWWRSGFHTISCSVPWSSSGSSVFHISVVTV